jgi:regulator of replication initiation timing
MLKGKKNDAILYLKGPQGLGKSTINEFLSKFILGKLYLESGSQPLTSPFNAILGGKLLVLFEELENFNTNEWKFISSVLKRFATSSVYSLQKKGIDPYDVDNINNYILLSNNNAIKDDEGRRYFILDLCTDYIGNLEFFERFRSRCFNMKTGHAFFCYMMEVNTDDFYAQKYPETRAKRDAISERLPNEYAFLKFNYILCNRSINGKVEDIYVEYKNYCKAFSLKEIGKILFNRKLEEIGIKYVRCDNGTANKYDVKHSKLMEIANKFKWIHDLDNFRNDIFADDEIVFSNSSSSSRLDEGVNSEEKENEIKELNAKLQRLENENKELKIEMDKLKLKLLNNQPIEEEITSSFLTKKVKLIKPKVKPNKE